MYLCANFSIKRKIALVNNKLKAIGTHYYLPNKKTPVFHTHTKLV